MVYYRKYRSQTIDEIDSTAVRETLLSILSKKDSVPHAFLFTGPKGLGKTSTARIIAKAINCEKKNQESGVRNQEKKNIKVTENASNIEPCNVCEQCVSITNGTNMDVLEIDAASNRGIDEIRDLKEKIQLTPLSAKKKIYIIDEVHMLTTEAFNALLKTLEEPPEHAVFILATTEPQKIPPTILSRCFHIQFHPATEEELVRAFKRIVQGETIAITDEALQYIARLADRGFRDGVKILEEIVSLSNGKKITQELIEDRYKVVSTGNFVTSLLRFMKEKKVKDSLDIVQHVVEQGIDLKYFMQQLISTLHALLLIRVANTDQLAPSDYTLQEIKEFVSILSKAVNETKNAVLPQLPLELAIIEYCQIQVQTISVTETVKSNEVVEASEKKVTVQVDDTVVSVASMRKQVGTIAKIKALYGEQVVKTENEEELIKETTELMNVPNDEITSEWLGMLWRNIISEMKQYNHTVAGVLRGCAIKSFDKKNLVIETAYKFHKERLEDMKTREALLKVCKLLTGKDIIIEVELKK